MGARIPRCAPRYARRKGLVVVGGQIKLLRESLNTLAVAQALFRAGQPTDRRR